MRPVVLALVLALSAGAARAHVAMTATLDAAQEVPEPAGVPAGAGGTGTFVVAEEDGTVEYDVQYQNLSGPPSAAHIHIGARCVAGPVAVPLQIPAGAETSGALTGTAALSAEQIARVLAGDAYVNIHTGTNPEGEVRGQIVFPPGTCTCDGGVRRCVRREVKRLTRAERRSDGIRTLRKRVKKAACGRTRGRRKAIGCCLPVNPDEGILTEPVCALVSARACGRLGGTPTGGTTCGPTNPCAPAAPAACR